MSSVVKLARPALGTWLVVVMAGVVVRMPVVPGWEAPVVRLPVALLLTAPAEGMAWLVSA